MKRVFFALLFTSSLFAQDRTGVFAPHETYEAPADHAPAAVSRMFVRTLTHDGPAVDLPAAGDSGMIIWTIPVGAKTLRSRLTTPAGDVLRPNENGSLDRGLRRFRFDAGEVGIDLPSGTEEVFHVQSAEAASYRLDADLANDVTAAIVVAAEPDSRITLETWVSPLSRQAGEPITLHAALHDGNQPITGAHLTARLAPAGGAAGKAIELIDRGDGTYSATIADVPAAGSWQARFEADGLTARNVRFARTGRGEFIAERGAAHLIADSVHATFADGVLHVTASADVVKAGNYRFDVIVAGAADANGSRNALAWGEAVRQLDRGANEIAIDIPASADAQYLDARLLGLDEIGVAGRAVVTLK